MSLTCGAITEARDMSRREEITKRLTDGGGWSPGTVIDYTIVSAPALHWLTHRVQDRIDKGWVPVGGPLVHDNEVHQAMTLTVDELHRVKEPNVI